jgi:hypothetical protein
MPSLNSTPQLKWVITHFKILCTRKVDDLYVMLQDYPMARQRLCKKDFKLNVNLKGVNLEVRTKTRLSASRLLQLILSKSMPQLL